MPKFFSRLALTITALSAVFFGGSQVFAITYYYNYTPSSPLISASNPCVKDPMAYSPNSPHGVPLWDSIFVNKSAAFSYITTSNDLVYKYRNGSTVGTGAIISNVDCYSLFGRTFLSNGGGGSQFSDDMIITSGYVRLLDGTYKNITINTSTYAVTVGSAYSTGAYYPASLNFDGSKFLPPTSQPFPSFFYLSGSILFIMNNGNSSSPTYVAQSLPSDAVLPVACATDNTASGGNCYCEVSKATVATGSGSKDFYVSNTVVSSFSGTYKTALNGWKKGYDAYVPGANWYSSDKNFFSTRIEANVDTYVPVYSKTLTPGSGTGAVDWSSGSGGSLMFRSYEGDSGTKNLFNSFVISSSSGADTNQSFEVYYYNVDWTSTLWTKFFKTLSSIGGGNFSIASDDSDLIYAGRAYYNTLFTLPSSTAYVKVFPSVAGTYKISSVSPMNITYSGNGNVCRLLSDTEKTALNDIISKVGRGSVISYLDGYYLPSTDFCDSLAFHVPYIDWDVDVLKNLCTKYTSSLDNFSPSNLITTSTGAIRDDAPISSSGSIGSGCTLFDGNGNFVGVKNAFLFTINKPQNPFLAVFFYAPISVFNYFLSGISDLYASVSSMFWSVNDGEKGCLFGKIVQVNYQNAFKDGVPWTKSGVNPYGSITFFDYLLLFLFASTAFALFIRLLKSL